MRAVLLVLAGAAAVCSASPASAAEEAPLPGAQAMRELERERGCTICHAEKTAPPQVDSILPPAPSWQQVAARYRNVPGAQKKLEELVLTGSDPNNRHWKDSAAIDRMLPNEIATTPEEAHQLVRWILSFR